MQEQLTHSVCLLFAWRDCREMQKGDGVLFVCSRYTGSAVNSAHAGTPATAACISRQPFVKSLHSKFLKHLHARTMPGAWNFDYQRSAVFCVYVCEINNTCASCIFLCPPDCYMRQELNNNFLGIPFWWCVLIKVVMRAARLTLVTVHANERFL